jgi:CheY-like chemotaxis protein
MPRTILVVEDIDIVREALEVALTRVRDIEVCAVESAEAAIQFLDSHEACAMVTDLHLPHMDGFELIQNVRSNPRYAALPIVVISGDSDPQTPSRLARIGADAYFSKPYSPADVRSTLEKLIHAS